MKCFMLFVAVSVVAITSMTCHHSTPPPPVKEESHWRIVPDLAGLDVRYMIQKDGVLYLAAVNPAGAGTAERGAVYSTKDGESWSRIKSIPCDIGPMTFNGDTLYCLASDSVYRYLPDGRWDAPFATPVWLSSASEDNDIVFIDGVLYAMATPGTTYFTYKIYPDGTFEQVLSDQGLFQGWGPFAGSKFLKGSRNATEVAYMRPTMGASYFYFFDGTLFRKVVNGLDESEIKSAPENSMAVRQDTLFAGFNNPGKIKILINDRWEAYTDTFPNPKCIARVNPPGAIRTQPTAIAFIVDQMFVATHSMGVLKLTGDRKWEQMSNGLMWGYIPGINEPDSITDSTLFSPVTFLEGFNGKLIAAYGSPGYAPWYSGSDQAGIGVYVYR